MKPKVLLQCDYYLPGFKAGGPLRSIQNLTQSLQGDFDFTIATRNHDFNDSAPYSTSAMHTTIQNEKINIHYFSENDLRTKKQLQLINDPQFDLIYLNSFFSRAFSMATIWQAHRLKPATPIIIAPRGELSAGALRIKAAKKRGYLTIAKWFKRYQKDTIFWHATSQEEAADIRKLFGNEAHILQASNIAKPRVIELHEHRQKTPHHCRLIFCSRISRKKNLNYALTILNQVKKSASLDIYGPIEDKLYWQECQHIIDKSPPHIKIHYKGELQPHEVTDTLKQYDLFFLPTMNENFGHAIMESFCAGTPVLLSNNTPWLELQKKGTGWDFPLTNLTDFIQTIEQVATMSTQEHQQWCQNSLDMIQQYLKDNRAIEDTHTLFKTALGKITA